jgi:hemerythrin
MALMTWQEQYSVGVPALDAQHKHLIDLLNQLHDGMRNGHGNDVLGRVLERLVTYTENHFRAEERYMSSCGFPALAQHIQEHRALTAKASALADDFRSGRVALSLPVLQFLKDWLRTHILASDQKYAAHARTKQPAMAAR